MIRTAEEFKRLRESDDPNEYRRAAEEEASLETWRSILIAYPEMAEWVAHNKTVPVEILAELINHPDPRVRSTVADKRKLPEQMMLSLAEDKDESVRLRLAHNRKASKVVLEKLAKDSWSEIRRVANERLAL